MLSLCFALGIREAHEILHAIAFTCIHPIQILSSRPRLVSPLPTRLSQSGALPERPRAVQVALDKRQVLVRTT